MIRAALFIVLLVMASTATPSCAESAAEDTNISFAALVLDPHPGARLPRDTILQDETGSETPLRALVDGKPFVLVFNYLHCKTICGLALANLADAAAALPDPPRIVAISIDPRDTPADAAAAHATYAAADWHFLTGPETAVRPLADAAGFHYRYDAATDQFIHSAGYIIVSGDEIVSSYLPDLTLTPPQLRAALIAAAQGETAAPLDRLLLLCFGGGRLSGRYTQAIEVTLILLNLAGLIAAAALFVRRVRQRNIELQ